MELKAFVISVGILNIPSGNTTAFGKENWSVYETPDRTLYLTSSSSLLIACEGTFKEGDKVQLIYNDTNRKVDGGLQEIISSCKSVKEDVIEWLFKHGYDYKPKRAFQKSKFTRKLRTSFSIKGTDNL